MKSTFLFFFLSVHIILHAQVVINEYSASNLRKITDNYGKDEDWIELYNNADAEANIGGWYLSDKEDKPLKWQFPQGTVIAPRSYLLVWASGRNESRGNHFHTNFKFTQTDGDEYVVLSDGAGNLKEKSSLIITQVGHSVGKETDAGSDWKVFDLATPGASNQQDHAFNGYAHDAKILTPAGFYHDSILVNIEQAKSGAVRFTTDGTEPDAESDIFVAPFMLKSTAVVKAREFSDDFKTLPGFIDFATYFINEPTSSLPLVSVAGTQAIELAEGYRDLNPRSSFEIFDTGGHLIARSFGELDSHGQDSWINPQRSLDWISRDQMGYDSGVKSKLFSYSNRDEYQRIILRASGDDNYPSIGDEDHEGSAHIRDEYVHTLVQTSGMHLDVRASERCLVYLNGQYWGVYTMREKPDDHDYTDYTYKQDKYDLQFLKTWGYSWAEYGGDKAFEDWGILRDHILNMDMANDENYRIVTEEMDVVSLMDYMLTNLSVVSSDWLNYNLGWWRGLNADGGHKKWGYIMWDNDATFDYYINYSGVPNTSPDAKACDIEQIADYVTYFFPQDTGVYYFEGDSLFVDGEWQWFPPDTFYYYPDPGRHELIFTKLFDESPVFRNAYLARYTDMINTVFSCQNMLQKLDSLVAIIEPEMPRHVARWEGSMEEWQSNIEKMKDFIALRCSMIDDGLKECYDLTGSFNVTVLTDPPDNGAIVLNTLKHQQLPWSGEYFGNMKNSVEVVPEADAPVFIHWMSRSGQTIFDDDASMKTSFTLNGSDTLVAVFAATTPVKELVQYEIIVSPNPASDQLHFDHNITGEARFTIVSLDGKKVLSGNLLYTENRTTVDISNLQEGCYWVHISSTTGSQVIKLIVMR